MRSDAGNALIDSLSFEDRSAVLELATPFDFDPAHVFCQTGDLVRHVDFPTDGIVSAVAVMEDGRTVETYMIGREGVTHPLAFDAASVCHSRLIAQAPGRSVRLGVGKLRALARSRPALQRILLDYAVGLVGELQQSTACNALHRAEHRFAKWLLRCHDRIDGDTLELTQEFLAGMLGAQRTTVNEAAQHLQSKGAIRYMRGTIRIQDRNALERAACECYAAHRPTLDAAAISATDNAA